MSEQLKHIFDISKCPTKRQMQDYLKGAMQPEEIYAFEHHISSCMLCSEAMDGMMERKEAALAGMSELNDNFLKDHLELHPPHIHLNGIAAAAAPDIQDKKKSTIHIWKPIGIAATLLLCLGLGWYFKKTPSRIAEHTPDIAQAKEEENSTLSQSPPTDKVSRENHRTAFSEVNRLAESPKVADIPPSASGVASENAPPITSSPQKEDATEKDEARKIAVASPQSAKKETFNTINTDGVTYISGDTYQQKADKEISSVGGARSNGTVHIVAGGRTDESGRKQSERKAVNEEAGEADELFDNGEYAQALAAYKKQMNGSNGKSSQQAGLMAARCYLNLGQKKNAQKLLSELAENGSGSQKRRAKRLLKEIEREE